MRKSAKSVTPHPVRIVYLIGQLGLGGSERQLYLLLKHMDKDRFDLHVVVFNPSANYTLDEDLRRAGVIVLPVPDHITSVRARVVWLYRVLRRINPHVLHSWSIHDNIYAGVVGFLAHIPHRLGSVRGSLASRDFQSLPWWERWLVLHGVQGHLVNSDEIAAEMRTAGVSTRRIYVLHNCVELDQVYAPVALDDIPSGARVVGMIGNLRQEKNYLLFIRCMAQIVSEFPDVYGVGIGQPVMASSPEVPGQVQAEIKSLGVSQRVKMLGFRADVPALLARFQIFCLTSNSEGTPNAILEAMAAGLPVVATRVGGIPHLVVDGVTGLLSAPGDVSGLVGALRSLLRDPERSLRMGTAGRQRAGSVFGCDRIVPQFENYYLSRFQDQAVASG